MPVYNQSSEYRQLSQQLDRLLAGQGEGQSGGGGASRGRGFTRGPQVEEEEPDATEPWNPSGFWPDPLSKNFSGADGYKPHEFVAALARSPESEDYTNPEGPATALGVEGAEQAGRSAKRDLGRNAQARGLGRGFAAQSGAEIDQRTRTSGAETMLTAHLEGQGRRFERALALTEALMGANEARFTDYLSARAERAAKKAGDKGILGGLLGGVGAIGGALIGAK